MIPGKIYKPEDVLQIAWRRKWLLVAPLVLVAGATFFGARLVPNRYQSETLILVVPQRVPESYVRSTVTMRIEDRLQSISQQILSRPRLERIISDFNLYADQRRTGIMEDIVERMRKDIDVQVVRGDAFRVTYVASEPRTAMRVVERLASLFIEENLRDRAVMADGTNQFLEDQLRDARQRLVEHEQKLEEYRVQHSQDLPSQLNSNMQAQHNTEMQVQALVDSLSRDRDRLLILERQYADASTATGAEPVGLGRAPQIGDGTSVESAGEQLAAARTALRALEIRLKPEHPDVVRAKRMIAELEVKAAAEATANGQQAPIATVSPAEAARQKRLAELRLERDTLTKEIANKENEEKQLRATIAAYQSHIEAVPKREAELSELTRDYDTLQQIYRGLLQKNEDSKVSANLEKRQIGEQFKVIDPAHLPEKPSSPDRLRIDLIGAIAGLVLGLALVAILEYLDTSLRSEADVISALALPVLALVPYVATVQDQRKNRRARIAWTLTGALTAVLALALLAWKMKA